jgi:hypothetical protein
MADPTAAQDAVTKNYGDLNYNPITAAKITALTAAAAGLGADELPVNEAGTAKKLTLTQLQAWITITAAQITALTAISAPAGTDEVPVNQAGTAKKLTLTQLQTWLSITAAQITALTAETTPAGTDEIPVNQGGTAKKITLAQINAYTEPVSNASIAQQSIAGAITYLTGSDVTIAPARLQARSFYRCKFNIVKSAAGATTPVVQVRMGTTGTLTDTAQIIANLATQTAVADEGKIEVLVNFRAVGASTIIQAEVTLWHRLTTTGLSATASFTSTLVTSAAFNSTTFTKIGVCVNPSTNATWTIDLVQADMLNLL